MKNTKINKRRQKKLEKRKNINKAKRKLYNRLKTKEKIKARNIVYQLFNTITHFFPDLFDRIRQIEDFRKRAEYELVELITAGIAMFLFKEGSRNAFNNDRQEGNFEKNYKRFFKMRLPHMDTVNIIMRQLNEKELEELKRTMVQNILEKKSLHKYRFLKKWFVVAVDGTGLMSFSEKHCEHCLHKTYANGKTIYFHNALEAKLVCRNGFSISIATEWIENPDSEYQKQDCEQKAFKRLAKTLKFFYPRLPICITVDGLYPNEPFFEICTKNNWRFVVTFEDGNLPSIWKKIEHLKSFSTENEYSQVSIEDGKRIHRDYCWINGIDYNDYQLNWIECIETIGNSDDNKKKISRFVYLTNIKIDRSNAAEIVQTGRLRWKIENEGFNTQKNLGYNLEHKYSRVSWLAAKNYYQCLQIGQLINQLLELSLKFKELLDGKITIQHLWKCTIGFLIFGDIDSEKLSIIRQLRTQVLFE